jgi:glycosyltransferase involved in cell wall biosynthesis
MDSGDAEECAGMKALRVGFVMEQVLGHVSHYQTLRGVMAQEPEVEATWIEVTYAGAGVLEKLPLLPWFVSSTARGYLQVRAGLRGLHPDALFFHTQKPAVFQWDLLARIPTVLSLDVTPLQYDALGVYYDHAADGDTPVARLKHAINKRTFALSKAVVVWSTWVKESLIQDYGVPAEKVRVIPPGVDLGLWNAPDRSSVSTGLPRILFVGGDFERKGGTLLLDWFRQAGRGRCELDLVTRAPIESEPGVRVHRTVNGNSPEARQLFTNADLFVLPSLGECFGIASVEAMAAGLPVIATRVGGSGDIVEHGETGLLIKPNSTLALGQALSVLVEDGAKRRAMGLRGRLRAERLFDGTVNARRLVSCIAEVSADRGALAEGSVRFSESRNGAPEGRPASAPALSEGSDQTRITPERLEVTPNVLG